MPATLSDYEVIETIGTGSYGVCQKIKRKKDGKVLVWKELNYAAMSNIEKTLLVSEVNLLRELRHKHIVRYYDRIINRNTSRLYIIMEYCASGDVGSFIEKLKKEGRRIDEPIVWKICSQILLALQECHSRSKNGKVVLHRDLKPANVFLDGDMNVKLGDFGLARVLNDDSFARTYVGTPYYMSPEQMNQMQYNEKSDIWSLGCFLYELTALQTPFMANNLLELSNKINIGRFARIPFRYSDELNALICTLIQVDESKRPSVDVILQHPKVQEEILNPLNSSDMSDSGREKGGRNSSNSSSEDGLSMRMESIKRREQSLIEREKALKEKEAKLKQKALDLTVREKKVQSREKLADLDLAGADIDILKRKLQQVERLKADDATSTLPVTEKNSTTESQQNVVVTPDKSQEFRSSMDISVPKSSILSASKNKQETELEVSKKKVSFLHVNINDTEKNNIYNIQSVERQLKMAEHTRQLYELHTQTRFSKFGRRHSSTDLTRYDYDKGLRNRPWLGLR